MAQDYAKKIKPKKAASRGRLRQNKLKQQQAIAPWVWLVAGLVLGLFIASLIYLKQHPLHFNERQIYNNMVTLKHREGHHEKLLSGPRFDFYTLLPKMKVWVPTSAADNETISSVTPPPPSVFVLQVASFRDYQDADQLKAQLILEGFDVEINPLKANNQVWNRVWVGPFTTETAAIAAEKNLYQQKKITGLILKIAK